MVVEIVSGTLALAPPTGTFEICVFGFAREGPVALDAIKGWP